MRKTKYYIGIDVGLKGGIAIINSTNIIYKPMPMHKDNNFVDIETIAKMLAKFRVDSHIVFEKLHGLPNQKLSVIWSLGRQVGLMEGIITALKIPYTEVTPQAWQKELFKGISVKYKRSKLKGKIVEKRDTKAMALTASRKLFPKEKFLATDRSRVPSDGIVDAVLLAEYGRRHNL